MFLSGAMTLVKILAILFCGLHVIGFYFGSQVCQVYSSFIYVYIFIYICIYLQGAKFSPSLCLLPTPKTCLALTFVKSGE